MLASPYTVGVAYSNPVAQALTRSTCSAVPIVDRFVPPLAVGRIPVTSLVRSTLEADTTPEEPFNTPVRVDFLIDFPVVHSNVVSCQSTEDDSIEVTSPQPAGVDQVPSPLQKVEELALVPEFRLVTGRLPVTSLARFTLEAESTQLVSFATPLAVDFFIVFQSVPENTTACESVELVSIEVTSQDPADENVGAEVAQEEVRTVPEAHRDTP